MNNINFLHRLNSKILESLSNNFGADNYDEMRFGRSLPKSVRESLINFLRKKFTLNYEIRQCKKDYDVLIEKYGTDLEHLYITLSEDSRQTLIDVIAYRILGFKKVKLPLSETLYRESLETVKKLKVGDEKISTNFMHFVLERFDLNKIGYEIELYFLDPGVAVDYIIEQYAYKANDKTIVQAEKGDTVLDIGGCWGDTALYFSHKVGESGNVHSFEFIPNNIDIFNKNIDLNPKLRNRINLVQKPVSDKSDQKIFYLDNGPGSTISDKPFENQTGTTETISIDDFVERYDVPKVDYIKMDIEGAEPYALKGAVNTIRKFRPKLAIAIYHSMEDFVNIPKWLIEQNLNYDFHLGHYTIHTEETVFFANPR